MTEFIIFNIPTMFLATIGGILAYKGVDGWGWFLLVAALISVSPHGLG